MIVRILLLFIALFTFGVQAQAIKESYAFAVLGEPRYAFNFNHFDYVNPAAPKGGQITLSALGTFDNFNRYALRGNPGARTEQLYDTLFTTSDDEPGSYYPLIAESARYADDYSWVEVAINPRAHSFRSSRLAAAQNPSRPVTKLGSSTMMFAKAPSMSTGIVRAACEVS